MLHISELIKVQYIQELCLEQTKVLPQNFELFFKLKTAGRDVLEGKLGENDAVSKISIPVHLANNLPSIQGEWSGQHFNHFKKPLTDPKESPRNPKKITEKFNKIVD